MRHAAGRPATQLADSPGTRGAWGQLQLGGWVPRTSYWSGALRLGSAATRANDLYGVISPGLITPSSIARMSSASLDGAGRPVAAYFARARLMYCRTVFSLIDMRRPTDAFDMPWNHSSSACRSCSDSAGRAGRWSASIALACDRVTYGRSAAAASTASTRWSRPSSLDTYAWAPLSRVSITIAGALCP